MLEAHCQFIRALPISIAGESGNENVCLSEWQLTYKLKEHTSQRSETITQLLQPFRPPTFSLVTTYKSSSLDLNEFIRKIKDLGKECLAVANSASRIYSAIRL